MVAVMTRETNIGTEYVSQGEKKSLIMDDVIASSAREEYEISLLELFLLASWSVILGLFLALFFLRRRDTPPVGYPHLVLVVVVVVVEV